MIHRIRQIGTALAAWARRSWWVIVGMVGLVVVVGIGVVFSLALAMQTSELMSQPDQAHADVARNALQYQADNLTKLWTGIVQAIGAVVLAIGGYFTWRNLRVTQERLDVDRQAQITNRFTQAIGQLGAETKDGQPNLEVRLGGIYALERIAKDSPRDHWTIMEILTAYVRQNARWAPPSPITGAVSSPEEPCEEPQEGQEPPTLRTDIQAILTVLGRRDLSADPRNLWGVTIGLDLRETDLRRVDLKGAHMEQTDLVGTHLEWAILWDSHLEGAILGHAHLERADLMGAHLEGASLWDSHLEGARLYRADLRMSKYLTQEQVKSCASRRGALLPPHLAHLEELDEAVTASVPPPPAASSVS